MILATFLKPSCEKACCGEHRKQDATQKQELDAKKKEVSNYQYLFELCVVLPMRRYDSDVCQRKKCAERQIAEGFGRD
jgi:hypothetical protein